MKTGLIAAALSVALAVTTIAGEAVGFASRPMLAGKASLTEEGYMVRHDLGTARFSPGLEIPVELVYGSASEQCGPFGFAWRSPQLESSARWDKDGMLWTAPWGEKVKFFPKNEKTPKDAVKIEVVEEAKKGRGYYAPYSDWEADVLSGNPQKGASWIVRGRRDKTGWSLVYVGSRLSKVTAPSGKSLDFVYGEEGLTSISQDGVAFVELAYSGRTATSVTVGGVRHALAYEDRTLEILPHTKDGRVARPTLPQLVSVRRASLAPVVFGYRGNFLASVRRGEAVEDIAFEMNGRVARITSDREFDYSYAGGVTLTDRLGRKASYDYNAQNGVFRISEFSGRKYEIYYFMRYDVAYLGRVRKIVDGKGNDVVGYRYDAKSGNVTRVRDRFGNDRNFEYDAEGRLVKATRRAAGDRTVEPVASFAYVKGRRPTSVALLDAKGQTAVTTRIAYDAAGRPVSVGDGRGKTEISYSRAGYPTAIKDAFGNITRICYNAFNAPVTVTDANGIVTEYSYNDAGCVTRIVRKDGSDVLSSLDVAYDKSGLPVSYTDQDGLVTAFERDAFGRVLKERFADGSEVGYTYDAFGRRTGVLDENGHTISFDWGRFGLKRRTTAAGQLTDYVRNDDGLVTEILSSQDGKTDRAIRNEYDDFGRLVYIDYGKGETESFGYDKWNRLASHTRGKVKETYAYDHFGRLVTKKSGSETTTYAYDAWGNRTSRITRNRKGAVISKETRAYDRFGRLAGVSADFGAKVTYAYDAKGRLARQTVDGSPIDYMYTRRGQLAGKYLGGLRNPDAAVEYEYSKSGKILARTANGVRQTFEYDKKGQLLAVKDADGNAVERYAYDRAGNMTKKTVAGRTTTFTFDAANQLVSSTCDGITTRYAYDAAGRMVKEGNRTYTYGYLDKVLSVKENDRTITYAYHPDGQLASANYGDRSESFAWDGLALIRRGDEQFINEPHVCGGNPVASSKGTTYFNDMLGTTVGAKSGNQYSAAALSAFGEDLAGNGKEESTHSPFFIFHSPFFTGKPAVEGLGYAFLMRNYRASLAKWQTADPMGYPDGWNQLAYCGNGVTGAVDLWGCVSLNGCVIPSNNLPMVKGAFAPDFGIGFSVAVKWTCNHDFDNPSITAEISVAEDSVAGPNFVFYKGDEFAFVQFDYIVKEDTAILINSDSMFQDLKSYELRVVLDVVAHVIYCDDEGNMFEDELDIEYPELLFQQFHDIKKEMFE